MELSLIKAIIFDLDGVIDSPAHGPRFNQPVATLITRLKPHYHIGLLSNEYRPAINRVLASHGIAHLFEVIHGLTESNYAKPDRQIFQEIAGLLHATFDEIIFIDDSPGHISAATSYGIRSILYHDPAQLEHDLKQMEIKF